MTAKEKRTNLLLSLAAVTYGAQVNNYAILCMNSYPDLYPDTESVDQLIGAIKKQLQPQIKEEDIPQHTASASVHVACITLQETLNKLPLCLSTKDKEIIKDNLYALLKVIHKVSPHLKKKSLSSFLGKDGFKRN